MFDIFQLIENLKLINKIKKIKNEIKIKINKFFYESKLDVFMPQKFKWYE